MRGRRLATLAIACLLFPSAVNGAEVSGGSDGDLKLSWTVEPQTRDYTAVCGNVFNQRRMSGRNIRITVEGLDGANRILNARDASAPRDIAALGGLPFCVTMPVGAARYRVRITTIDWDQPTGQ
jgi:hypothetical protein